MRVRRLLTLLPLVGVLTLAACGSGSESGFGCSGRTCNASFQGPGEQDLSSELGPGATVAWRPSTASR